MAYTNKFCLGENLKKYRNLRKLSQDELAAKLSTTKNSIYNYEKGISYPSVEVAHSICEALSITPNELFYGVSESPFGTEKILFDVSCLTKKDIVLNLIQCLNISEIFDYEFESRKDKYEPSKSNDVLSLFVKDKEILKYISTYLQNKKAYDNNPKEITKKLDNMSHLAKDIIYTGTDEEF